MQLNVPIGAKPNLYCPAAEPDPRAFMAAGSFTKPPPLIGLGADRISPALPCLAAAVIHCRPLQAGARWREILLLLLLLPLLLLQLLPLLLLLLLLQRPNEFHKESDRAIWCTGTPNNCLFYIHFDSIQQL